MKTFIKHFVISIVISGLLMAIAYLLSFTPLDSKNGSFFSNGFIPGFILLFLGIFRIRPSHYIANDIDHTIYGVTRNNSYEPSRQSSKKFFRKVNADAYGYILAAVILLGLSFSLA